jgi:TetR/AcrR family transcriptional repressor of nem operon
VTNKQARRTKAVDTPQKILDVAERLVQTRGFNGFSYADIAAELEITKPALHYHFANKAELGRALVERYTDRFASALVEANGSQHNAATRLATYTGLYVDVLRHGRMCLCGMLAAEYQTLPEQVQQAVMGFFDRNETWIVDVLERGRDDRTLRFDGEPSEVARFVVSELEGAMLLARLRDDPELFETAVRRLLDGLRSISPAPELQESNAAHDHDEQ